MSAGKVVALCSLLAVVGGGLYVRDCHNFQDEKGAHWREVDKYYKLRGLEAAELALNLARPYMNAENRGRILQRIDALREYYRWPPSLFDSPHDSYDSIVLRIESEMMLRAQWNQERRPQEEKTLFQLIQNLVTAVRHLDALSSRLWDIRDRKTLAKTRQEFVERKAALDAALDNAGRQLAAQAEQEKGAEN